MSPTPETVFQSLSDTTRLRCLVLMATEDELCVCELTHALGLSQPKVSRHLARLREVGLVQDRREGQWVHYRLHPRLAERVRGIVEAALAGTAGREPYLTDRQRLAAMPNRPGSRCCA